MSREDNEGSKHYQETLEAGKFLNNRELVRVLVNNAWHLLINISIGWYAIRKALKEGSRRRIMQISSLFGLFWGFCSIICARFTCSLCHSHHLILYCESFTGIMIPTNIIVYLITTSLGFLLFVYGIVKALADRA